MKNESIPSSSLASAIPQEVSPVSGKRNHLRALLVVMVLSVIGYFIIKLQQTEPRGKTLATAVAVRDAEEKTEVKPKPAPENKSRSTKETINPAKAVRANIRWRKNLVGETILEGTLTNTSKAVSIKNTVIMVKWVSKENRQFATTNYSIPEMLEAQASIPYKLKVKAPGKYASLKVSVESVTTL
jgi:hypothetical protein